MARVVAVSYVYDDSCGAVRAPGAEFEVTDSAARALGAAVKVVEDDGAKTAAKPTRRKTAASKGA